MRIKKLIEIEEATCDVCGESVYIWDRCMNCGGDFCRAHSKSYPYSVLFSGSADGRFCNLCDAKLHINPTPIFTKYRKVEELREELDATHARCKQQGEELEQEIRAFYDAWKAAQETTAAK